MALRPILWLLGIVAIQLFLKERALVSKQDLPAVLKMILNEIKRAAQHADVGAIARWSNAAEQCEIFIRETTELERRVRDFVDALSFKPGNVTTSGKELVGSEVPATKRRISPILWGKEGSIMGETPARKRHISAKREGAEKRGEWVATLSTKYIPLTGHEKRYYTKRGKSIGIAFANELDRPQLADKWFLGLKDEPTDVAVLLCQDKEGNLYDFVVPVAELGSSWKTLSRSGGQVKFNIYRRNSEFLLLIPGGDPLDVTNYLSSYGVLT